MALLELTVAMTQKHFEFLVVIDQFFMHISGDSLLHFLFIILKVDKFDAFVDIIDYLEMKLLKFVCSRLYSSLLMLLSTDYSGQLILECRD